MIRILILCISLLMLGAVENLGARIGARCKPQPRTSRSRTYSNSRHVPSQLYRCQHKDDYGNQCEKYREPQSDLCEEHERNWGDDWVGGPG
jgi:hypothetical protein